MTFVIDRYPGEESWRLGAMALQPTPGSVIAPYNPLCSVDVHSPGFPASVRLRRPDTDDAHGRGLLLVDSIADSWRSGPSRFGGTVVSFVMADVWTT